jgi:protein-tyrosine phosphatase
LKWDNGDMVWIDLEGAVNVRDLGGLPTTDGGTTLPGRLLRSENLQDLSPADVSTLVKEIGVSTVVDLRTTGELEIEGPAPLDAVPTVRHAHHPVLKELGNTSEAVSEALLVTKIERDRARYPDNVVTGHYLGYLEERPEEVTAALRSIATSEGAAIVHCAAGKDRTGVIVAMALTAAQVQPEAIVADYVATGDRIDAIIERLRQSRTYAKDMSTRPVSAHLPHADTMTAFLEQLDARYGGLPRWLAANGFADDEYSLLRAKLRQP